MKGGRGLESISGRNNLVALLCRYHTKEAAYKIVEGNASNLVLLVYFCFLMSNEN